MFKNYWVAVAPLFLVTVWALAWKFWILFVSKRRGKVFARHCLWVVIATVMTMLLHVESHRGLVQRFRDSAGDVNGVNDLEYAICATLTFLAVSALYATAVYYGAKLIAWRRARKAAFVYKAKFASRITIVEPPQVNHAIMTLNASTIRRHDNGPKFSLGLTTYEFTIDCAWDVELTMSEAAVPTFLDTLPGEIRNQARIGDVAEPAERAS